MVNSQKSLNVEENYIKIIILDPKVVVVDFGCLLEKNESKTCEAYFEAVYNNGPKVDKMHLNLKGFRLLAAVLHIHYFESVLNV